LSRVEEKSDRQAGKRNLSWHAWLPVVGLAVAMIVVWRLNLRGPHESIFLVTLLQFLFTSLVSAVIVYVAGRGFALTGNPGLLWFSSGILVWGATGGIGGAAVAKSVNAAVTIQNTGLLISAACHLIGALRTGADRKLILRPGLALVAVATGAAGLVGILTIAALAGRLPVFFVQGHGGTPLRFGVLSGAAGLYLLSAGMLLVRSRRLVSPFLFWYSAGLVLLTCGVLGIMFEPVVGGALSWLGRSAQYLGGTYLAVAALVSGAEARIWGVNIEGKLRESYSKYKALIETTSDFIWEMDASGKYTYCSPQMEEIWGIKPEEMIGKTPFEQMPVGAREEGIGFYRTAVETKSPFAGIQVPSLDARGRLITVEISGVPFFDSKGEVAGFRGISRDVTERRKMEEALRESEERLKDFFDNASGVVWVKDVDGRFLKINSHAAAVIGRPVEDFIGRTVTELYPGSHGDAYADNDRRVIESGAAMEFEETLELADGLHTFVSVKFPVRDSTGTIYGVGAICTDITEKKRLEDLLHVKSEEQEIILDSAPAMIFYKDAENRFLRVNRAFEKSMGLAKEELEGRSLFDLYPNELANKYWADDLEVIRTGKAKFDIIEPMETPQGRRLLQTDKIPYVDESGAVRGVIGLSVDITERKKAEEVLKRDRETLEQLVRERTAQLLQAHEQLDRARRLSDIGVLAATVAHELRNPLAAISMAVHNIKRKAGNPELDRHLANIDKKISESDQIINNLLFYSRLRPPQFERVKILDVLEESIESAEDKNKRDVSIIRNLDCLANVSIDADPFQMKELFVNVLNNAYDAAPERAGELRISSEIDNEHITISFEDNGPGIAPDLMDKVFDPFFTTKTKGVGLGLSVCRQIVGMHGGDIGVKDGATKGTCVVVRLPKRR